MFTEEELHALRADRVPYEEKFAYFLRADGASYNMIDSALEALVPWTTLLAERRLRLGDACNGVMRMQVAADAVWGEHVQFRVEAHGSTRLAPCMPDSASMLLRGYYLEELQDEFGRSMLSRWGLIVAYAAGESILDAVERELPSRLMFGVTGKVRRRNATGIPARGPTLCDRLSAMLLQVLRLHLVTSLTASEYAQRRREELRALVRDTPRWPIVCASMALTGEAGESVNKLYCLAAETKG